MKITLELEELRAKNSKDLYQEMGQLENKTSQLQFKAAFKKIKNFREIRLLKKRRARIWTILAERAMTKVNNDKK